MLDHWLEPISKDAFPFSRYGDHQIGSRILLSPLKKRVLGRCRIALVGIDSDIAQRVRQEFYQLAWPFGDEQVVDLGNARRDNVDFLIPILRELLSSDIFPLLIGGPPQQVQAQYRAFNELRSLVSLIVVDEQLALTVPANRSPAYYLNAAIHTRRQPIFHLGVIGVQAHLVAPAVFDYLEQRNFECIRLGKARAQLGELEPLVRDGDLISFNLAAIKHADAPATGSYNPSGFTLEEMCQVARYAGLSDKLRSCGVYGFAPTGRLEADNPTAHAAAQVIWYFLEGFFSRKGDFPVSNEGLTEYIVDFKGYEQITFWKSNKSGRWWVQTPVNSRRKDEQRHRLIPCSYSDYLLACQGELPDRLITAFRRFD